MEKTWEGGQARAGCSLQEHCFRGAGTTCPLLRRAIVLERRRHGQMDGWMESAARERPCGQEPFPSALGLLKGLHAKTLVTICSPATKSSEWIKKKEGKKVSYSGSDTTKGFRHEINIM